MSRWPARPWFGAPRGVWETRWSRLLRHLSRSHGRVSGEVDNIERMGLVAFLRADDAHEWVKRDEETT